MTSECRWRLSACRFELVHTCRFYFIGVYIYHFVVMFLYLTFFSARSTVPDFVPVALPAAAAPMDVAALRFGIGRDCVRELIDATYTMRSCMLPCDQLRSAAQSAASRSPDNVGMLLSPSYLRFDKVLRVRAGCRPHIEPLVNRLQRFAEAGLYERLFGAQHRRSYAGLVESRGEPPMRLEAWVEFVYSLLVGLLAASVAFGAELVWWWVCDGRRKKSSVVFEFVP